VRRASVAAEPAGKYVVEEQVIDLPAAVRSTSSLAANVLHLGHIRARAVATPNGPRAPIAAMLLACCLSAPAWAQHAPAPCHVDVFEATIPELQTWMAKGRVTSVSLVDAYLARIAAYDQSGPRLNAILRLNPRARAVAATLDAERRAGHVRGPLHGIPILLKDNYNTVDLPTTGGSIALAGSVPPSDAFQVKKLRDAGAVILGKTNMHELASGITTISSIGGQTLNPYDPARIPGGSSGGSGAATAASFAAVAYGTDTCGSIRIPAAFNNLFGLRPTKGLSSTAGIIPLSHSQDVAGPLARTVTDLALALDATVGPDPLDSATRILEGRQIPRFADALDTAALRGVRIGVLRAYFGDQPDDQEVSRVVEAALKQMASRGAQLVEVRLSISDSLVRRADVTNLEFKFDLAEYLAATPLAPVRSLAEILERGLYHAALEPILLRRDSARTRDSDLYRAALAQRVVVRQALLELLDREHLDALVYPTMWRVPAVIGEPVGGATCLLSSVTGFPALAAPAGFTRRGLPVGLELLARPLEDARLIAWAYAYEQATHPRRSPPTTPRLIDAHAPEPLAFAAKAAVARGGSAHATFSFDPVRGKLRYHVLVSGVPSTQIYATALSRGGPARRGPIIHRLTRLGVSEAAGDLVLRADERTELVAGQLYLTVYTKADPAGMARSAVVPESSRKPVH